MTQEQKTEAVLDAAMCKSYRVGGAIAEIEAVTEHARDLARKNDELEEQLTLAKDGEYARALWQANRDLRLKNESLARKLDAVMKFIPDKLDKACPNFDAELHAILEAE